MKSIGGIGVGVVGLVHHEDDGTGSTQMTMTTSSNQVCTYTEGMEYAQSGLRLIPPTVSEKV